MKLFGALHFTILTTIVAIAVAAAWCCRTDERIRRLVQRTLGAALAVNEIVWWVYRYSREGVHLENLPLQLCDVAVWLAVAASFSDAAAILEPAYFAGMAGAAMALLTPDLFTPWPTYPAVYFFVSHGGIVVCLAVAVFGARKKFRSGAVWRSMAELLIYAAIVGTFDRISGANYMYLMRKPKAASPLDAMGPWPWYLLSGIAVALALFWLMWLPVRRKESERQPVFQEQA